MSSNIQKKRVGCIEMGVECVCVCVSVVVCVYYIDNLSL